MVEGGTKFVAMLKMKVDFLCFLIGSACSLTTDLPPWFGVLGVRLCFVDHKPVVQILRQCLGRFRVVLVVADVFL
jgi:hypothetical protein